MLLKVEPEVADVNPMNVPLYLEFPEEKKYVRITQDKILEEVVINRVGRNRDYAYRRITDVPLVVIIWNIKNGKPSSAYQFQNAFDKYKSIFLLPDHLIKNSPEHETTNN